MMATLDNGVDRYGADNFEWLRSRNLISRSTELRSASLEEIVALLSEAVEVYTVLAPMLPTPLLEQACVELDLLTQLCREISQRNL
jgi:hypothetical protein